MHARLRPDETITAEDLARGRRAMVHDAAWATLVGALYGGVILVGFALELGATPFVIGLIAAIPFLAQVAQLPAVVLIERLRQRRKLAVLVVTAARLLILSLALLPWLVEGTTRLWIVVAAQVLITLLGAMAGCAVNSWFHQLLAGRELGSLYAQRLFWSTVLASLGALAAGHAVEHWPFGDKLHGYAACFAVAGLVGFIGVRALMRIPEPVMHTTGPQQPLLELLRGPLSDPNFRRLIVFMASWNFASNLAGPFLTVYLLQQLGFGLGTVTALWAASQMSNALTLYAWGRISDRLSNKGILATALPAYFACLIGLPAASLPDQHVLTLPLIAIIHVVMGMASGGIGLATGNIGLKLAPQGRGTAYLASVSLAGAFAGGMAALMGGALADWFASVELTLQLRWSSLTTSGQIVAMQFQHWEFLFGIAFALGLYVLHALSRVQEGPEVSEREVIRDFVMQAGRVFGEMSSTVATSLAIVFPFGRVFDRRRRTRASERQLLGSGNP
ncbi:MAG TPA: MFS transporter [Burkholderiales bacterium]|nr:MFS transporter [Burkholderiales bacterium]